MEIKTHEDLRSAATQLNAYSIALCNDTNIEDLTNHFLLSKDILIAIYRYKAEQLNEEVT